MTGAEAIARGEDLVGAHVTMAYDGRTLVGTVVAQEKLDDDARTFSLRVRHFNGEAWPLAWVPSRACTVLQRV